MDVNTNGIPATEKLFCKIKVRRLVCPRRMFARIEAGTC